MPKKDIVRYQRQYEKAKALVNPLWRADFASFIRDHEDCSDDTADDFAAWVVMQGRVFFEKVVADPGRLAACLAKFQKSEEAEGESVSQWDEDADRPEYEGYQRADYVATPIY